MKQLSHRQPKKKGEKKQCRGKKRKKRGNVPLLAQEIQKKKKNIGIGQGYFCPLSSFIFNLQFSLHFGEKTFWWARGENT